MRLAVISDIHGNLPALEKAFAFIDKINIDGIIWCGDYITDILLSSEVLEFIKLKNKKYKHWIIKGNREDYMIDYHNSSDKDFSLIDATGSLLLTYNSLSKDDIKYISSLPDEVVVDIKGCPQIYVRHKLNSESKYKYHVFGHIHKQGLFIKNDCRFINPGSVGQCCSGSPGVEFALMELVDGEWNTHFYHMNYNYDYNSKGRFQQARVNLSKTLRTIGNETNMDNKNFRKDNSFNSNNNQQTHEVAKSLKISKKIIQTKVSNSSEDPGNRYYMPNL